MTNQAIDNCRPPTLILTGLSQYEIKGWLLFTRLHMVIRATNKKNVWMPHLGKPYPRSPKSGAFRLPSETALQEGTPTLRLLMFTDINWRPHKVNFYWLTGVSCIFTDVVNSFCPSTTWTKGVLLEEWTFSEEIEHLNSMLHWGYSSRENVSTRGLREVTSWQPSELTTVFFYDMHETPVQWKGNVP